MSSDKTLTQIIHYQKKLEKYAAVGETEKLLCCIHKLKYLPVTVNHLEITGVGKSINSLRHKNGIIGIKARALVQKWMMMVDKEEEPDEQVSNSNPNEVEIQENEVEDHSDEGDHLQIEEDPIPSYNPGGHTHSGIDIDTENCNGYNPHTSRQDYLSIGGSNPTNVTYNPSVKEPDEEEEPMTIDDSPERALLSNGNSSHAITPKEDRSDRSQSSSKAEEKYKKKKHKSRHNSEEKHKSRDNSEGLGHKKSKKSSSSKHKDKRKRDKESKDKHKSHSSSKKTSHSSTHHRESQVTTSSKSSPTGSASPTEPVPEKKRHSNSKGDSSKDKSKSHSQKEREKNNNDKVKEKKSHKSSKSSKEHKSRKREFDSVEQAESSSAFGAVLMGLDSSSPSKKKKKKKDRDRDKEKDEKRTCDSPVKLSKPQVLQVDYGRDRLPELPSGFADDEPADEMPQLLTHYKPLPHVPQRVPSKDPFTSQMTDEEALNYMLSSKNNKQRRIYAGKATGLNSVPTLFDCCIRVLQENIDALEATGGIPYDILKPVLEKASPQQLFLLEDYNPYLLEDTDVLWAAHCRKKFRNKQREDMETWRDLFIRSTDEQQVKEKRLTEQLTQKYVTKAQPTSRTQIAFVNTAAKPPKSVKRAQAKYGTASVSAPVRSQHKSEDTPRPGGSSGGPARPDRPFPNKPPAAKKPKTAPIMVKARQLMKKVCRR